jgi:hypothetical protein
MKCRNMQRITRIITPTQRRIQGNLFLTEMSAGIYQRGRSEPIRFPGAPARHRGRFLHVILPAARSHPANFPACAEGRVLGGDRRDPDDQAFFSIAFSLSFNSEITPFGKQTRKIRPRMRKAAPARGSLRRDKPNEPKSCLFLRGLVRNETHLHPCLRRLTTLRDTGCRLRHKNYTICDRLSEYRRFTDYLAEGQGRLDPEWAEADALRWIVKEPPSPLRVGKGGS